ncbi:hypothetical protein PLICRDRAFT_38761 [Plicaturopsis crispa FD-325 SS-3]|nr:hypothetical protein PLICRDRAFT_38761 [Plicaturopsis crispa FD-325 SS-3]
MRCDGQRPVCGQCQRANRNEDCEYTDGQGRSRTQLLEEDIARLEARVQELEHPEEPQESITLFDPYGSSVAGPSSTSREYGTLRPSSSPTGRSSVSSSSSHQGISVQSMSPEPSSMFHPQNASDRSPWWTLDEPPASVIQELIDVFLSYADELNFCLNIPLFREEALLTLPLGHHFRPSPAVLSVVYLWGVRLAGNDFLGAHEHIFLARALHQTAESLAGDHPRKIVHAVQAEVLLAQYFFWDGRFLEGKYHSSAAAALAFSCGLHKIRSDLPEEARTGGSVSIDLLGNSDFELPPPRDAVEEGERINVFWAVFVLDKCWSATLGWPSSILDRGAGAVARIDTPWPRTMDEYAQGLLPSDARGNSTLDTFMTGTTSSSTPSCTLHAQAVYLFSQAGNLCARWTADMPQPHANAFYQEFLALNGRIDSFVGALLERSLNATSAPDQIHLLALTLAYVAKMQLSRIFAGSDQAYRYQCIQAAISASSLTVCPSLSDTRRLPIIMSYLWTAVSLMLIDEISARRAYRSSWASDPSVPTSDQETEALAALERVMGAMSTFAPVFPLMRFQYERVRQSYNAL